MTTLKIPKIPKICDEKLNRLMYIMPVNKDMFYYESCDPRGCSFSWGKVRKEQATDLKELCSIRTLHTFSYYGFFKPTVAEVLSQIPDDLLDKVVAFRTIGPETAQDLNLHKEEFNAGFHVAETILYSKQ